jgi:hypothetical protein
VAIWTWSLSGLVLGHILKLETKDKNRLSEHSKVDKNFRQSKSLSPLSIVMSITLFVMTWTYAYPDRKLTQILNKPISQNTSQSLEERKQNLIELSESSFFQPQHAIITMQALNEIQASEAAIDIGFIKSKEFNSNFNLLNYLAFLLEQSRRYPEAISVRQRQIVLDPRHGGVWLAIAFDAREAGLSELKVEALKNARKNAIYMGENFEAKINSFFPEN